MRRIVLPVQMGGLLGGPKGMLAPPLKLLGGLAPPGPSLFLRLWTVKNFSRPALMSGLFKTSCPSMSTDYAI